jgi:hypothetical protein
MRLSSSVLIGRGYRLEPTARVIVVVASALAVDVRPGGIGTISTSGKRTLAQAAAPLSA